MKVVHQCCCGIDVHKKTVVVNEWDMESRTTRAVVAVVLCFAGAFAAHGIVGGEDMPASEYRFVVYVEAGGGSCTGALIAPTWVITAAHCVVPHGAHEIERGWPMEFEERAVVRVVAHPDYYYLGAGFRHDIALIEIARPFDQFDTVSIVAAETGMEAVGIGWGERALGVETPHAHGYTSPTWIGGDCRARFEFMHEAEIANDVTLCAGDSERGIRPGDSGGPLVVSLPGGGWGLIGVASIHGETPRGQHVTSVYAIADLALPWIEDVLSGAVHTELGTVPAPTPEPTPSPVPEEVPVVVDQVPFAQVAATLVEALDATLPGGTDPDWDVRLRAAELLIELRRIGEITENGSDQQQQTIVETRVMTQPEIDLLCDYVSSSDHRMIDEMVEAGADVNQSFGHAHTVVNCAATPRTLEYLVEEHGANPNGGVRDGGHWDTPLCKARTLEMAKAFVRLGAVVRGRGDSTQSLVECAAYYGDAEMVQWWRQQGEG